MDGLPISEQDTKIDKDTIMGPPRLPGMTYDEHGTQILTLEQLLACTSAVKRSRDETDEDITHSQLQARFDEATTTWQASSCRDELLKIITEHQPDDGDFDKVVCLGSGRFCQRESNDPGIPSTATPGPGKKSIIQLACVVDIAREMEKKCQCKVDLLAQDPQYTPRDLALLASQGVQVLEMDVERHGLNVAKDHMGPRTILFEFHASKDPNTLEDMYSGDIGLVIGSSVERVYDAVSMCWKGDERLDRQSALDLMDKFEDTHDSCDFPLSDEHTWVFRDLEIYWLAEGESDADSGQECDGESEVQDSDIDSEEQESDLDSEE